MARSRALLACVTALALLLGATHCDDQGITRPPPSPPVAQEAGTPGTSGTSGGPGPAPLADGGVPPAGDGGCPAPRSLSPADVGPGYLAPVQVTLVRPIDGDTAHFLFPQSGEQACRFLFVNTEESFGEETTPFGVETKAKVDGWLRAAKQILVVPREAPGGGGQPDIDAFDRWLSLVFLDGELVQTRLVREGLTPYFTSFGCATDPVHSTLLHAEAEANGKDLGIWAPSHPKRYDTTTRQWIGRPPLCRPNPFVSPYCP